MVFVSSSKDMVDIFKDACKSRRLYEHRLLLDEFFRLAMQIFFILYGFTGNPLYDREMFVPLFYCMRNKLINYANNDDGSELE